MPSRRVGSTRAGPVCVRMSSASQGLVARRPKRVACTECRQQKARCDASSNLGQPCSRCRRFDVPCIISNSFQRQHKRKKLSELEREAEVLREQLAAAPSTRGATIAEDVTRQASPATRAFPSSTYVASTLTTPQPSSWITPDPVLNPSSWIEPTISRSLNGISLGPQEIDELYLM